MFAWLSPFVSRKDPPMWLFVGLGNPGGEYQGHRHNVGFMAVEAIADGAAFKRKFQGQLSEVKLGGEKAALLMPQTFMNLSGESVGAAARFYKIPPARIVVFHDEIDLAPGDIRVKQGGGNAGHNGLKSIQQHLGTPDFWRVRIGVGRPAAGGDVSDYVLHDFAKADRAWLEAFLDAAAKHADVIIREGPRAFEKVTVDDIQRAIQKLC